MSIAEHFTCGKGHVHICFSRQDENSGEFQELEFSFWDIDTYREFVNECREYLSEIETKVPEVFFEHGEVSW